MNVLLAMANAHDGRVLQRANLLLAATMIVAGRRSSIRVRDLSETGARVEGSGLPAPGNPILIERGPLQVSGTVRWRTASRAGIQFNAPIDVASWSPSAAESIRSQAHVDNTVAVVRAGIAHIDDAPTALVPDQLRSRIAEELCCLSRMLDATGETMAKEVPILVRHPGMLQELDMAARLLAELATLVERENPAEGIAQLKLSALQRRLTRSSL